MGRKSHTWAPLRNFLPTMTQKTSLESCIWLLIFAVFILYPKERWKRLKNISLIFNVNNLLKLWTNSAQTENCERPVVKFAPFSFYKGTTAWAFYFWPFYPILIKNWPLAFGVLEECMPESVNSCMLVTLQGHFNQMKWKIISWTEKKK
jgi:hypothetical protein